MSVALLNTAYDVVVVGSSPMMIIEALYQELQGHRVALVEKASELGGPWRTKTFDDIANVEVGCHIIHHSEESYQFLTDWLGLELSFLPTHYLFFSSAPTLRRPLSYQFVSYQFTNWAFRLAGKIKRVLLRRSESAPTAFLSNRFQVSRKAKVLYPKNGCSDLMNSLRAKLSASNVDVFLDTAIKSITVSESDQVQCRFADGVVAPKEFVVIGQYTDLAVTVNAQPLRVSKDTLDWVHVTLHLKATKKKKFGYVVVFDTHKTGFALSRIADVTPYSSLRKDGELLICCQLSTQGAAANLSTAEITEKLVEAGFLEAAPVLLAAYEDVYTSGWLTGTEFEALAGTLPKQLKMLRTQDLSEGIAYHFDEWKALAEAV